MALVICLYVRENWVLGEDCTIKSHMAEMELLRSVAGFKIQRNLGNANPY
jgi:hypothetical protein